ncbi:spermidine/putrescine ABC transporter substrate-binding protein [Photobacterium sagamiensis]|uniref:polyamine ABC transporter substrate-binding protein n=1 Tax=Photobacterium sagamiensis TaxID=2910241 RepID=UPI003D0B96EC
MNKILLGLIPRVMRGSILTATLATALLSPVYSIAAGSTKTPSEITFLTWYKYISDDVVAEFEAEYNAKVNFVYFDSDDTRNVMLTRSGTDEYDLILLDSVSIPLYKKLNWVTSFNHKSAPNLNHVKLPVLSNLDKKDHSCAPYTWGTTGIAYRKDLVPEPITSWKQIFDPAPELQGKIVMSILAEEVVGMALKSLGYSMGSDNRQELEEARQLLLAQAPAVAGYSAVTADAEISKLVSGEVSVVLTYSSDALSLKEAEPQIEYVLPEEGGAIWADFICLSAKANNPELAHRFINFINQPEQAANNALFMYTASPNLEAEKLLPADFLNDPIIYPNKALTARSETYNKLSPRTIKKQNSIMNELRSTLE